MTSRSSTPTVSTPEMLCLMVLACVLPLVILFGLVSAGFSPPPIFVFFLVVVAPLMALRMTLAERKLS